MREELGRRLDMMGKVENNKMEEKKG